MKNLINNIQKQKFPLFKGLKGISPFLKCLGVPTLLLLSLATFAQTGVPALGTYLKHRCLGGTQIEQPVNVVRTTNGDIAVMGLSDSADGDITNIFGSGTLDDIFITRLDSAGNKLWSKNYGTQWPDDGLCLLPTPDNGLLFLARVTDNGPLNDGQVSTPRGKYDAWVVKLDANGNIQWEKSYGGSEHDYPFDMVLIDSVTVAMIGETASSDFDCSLITSASTQTPVTWYLKFNLTNGQMLYSNTIYFPGQFFNQFQARKIETTNDGHLLILGSGSTNNPNNGYSGSVFFVKITNNAVPVWGNYHRVNSSWIRYRSIKLIDIVKLPDGTLIYSANLINHPNADSTLMCFTPPLYIGVYSRLDMQTGSTLWLKCDSNLMGAGMCLSNDNKIIACGYDFTQPTNLALARIDKFNFQGQLASKSLFGSATNGLRSFDYLIDAVAMPDGTYWCLGATEGVRSQGQSSGNHSHKQDLWLVKIRDNNITTNTIEPKPLPNTLQIQTLSQGVYKLTLGNYSPPVEGQGWSLERQGSAILTDVTGRNMKEIPLKQDENSFEIDLTEYAQGIYFLNISGYKTLKLVR